MVEKSIAGSPARGKDTLLRRLLAVYGAAVAAICVVAAIWISQVVWPNFEHLEHREAERRMEAVIQALRSEEDRLSDLTNTYGVWDDTYDFLRGANPSLVAVDLNPAALDQIEVDVAILFDAADATIFKGLRREDLSSALSELENAAREAPGLVLSPQTPRRTALVAVGERVFILAKRQVVRTDGSGVSPGTITLVRELASPVMARMAELSFVDFRLHSARSTGAVAPPDVRISTTVQDAWGE